MKDIDIRSNKSVADIAFESARRGRSLVIAEDVDGL